MPTELNWKVFEVKHADSRRAFEDLCYHLFCRRYHKTSGIQRYLNQVGIETEPIQVGKKVIGFQSKYFDNGFNHVEFIESIKKAKQKNRQLTDIILYTNKEFRESSKEEEKESVATQRLNKTAVELSVAIEWFLPSNFQETLFQKPGAPQLCCGKASFSSVSPGVSVFCNCQRGS